MSDIFELQSQLNQHVEHADVSKMIAVFKELVAHRSQFARETELYQHLLNKVFEFSDAHPAERKLASIAQQHVLLRDVAALSFAKQRADGISVSRIYEFFGISFDEAVEQKEEEDTTSPLDYEQTIDAITADQGHDYIIVRQVIERSTAPKARVHLALQFLEQAVEQRSEYNVGDFIVFLLRELYVLHPELQTDQIEGRKQKQFETRFTQVVAELSDYCKTANLPFICCYMQLRHEKLCGALLRDFSKLHTFEDSFAEDDEPARQEEAGEKRSHIVEALRMQEEYAKLFASKGTLEICKNLFGCIQNPDENDKYRLAIAVAREEGANSIKPLVEYKNAKRTQLFKTVMLECSLSYIKAKKLRQAARFLSDVVAYGPADQSGERPLVYASQVEAGYFDDVSNLDGVCNLVAALADVMDLETTTEVQSRLAKGSISAVEHIVKLVAMLDFDAVNASVDVSPWQPLGELVECVLLERAEAAWGQGSVEWLRGKKE